jgi:hypothetical protein
VFQLLPRNEHDFAVSVSELNYRFCGIHPQIQSKGAVFKGGHVQHHERVDTNAEDVSIVTRKKQNKDLLIQSKLL